MENNVKLQLQRAIEMKEKTKYFADQLRIEMDDLEDRLWKSVCAGFPEDIADTYYHAYFIPDRTIIEDLSDDMLKRHVDYLDRVIDGLKDTSDQK